MKKFVYFIVIILILLFSLFFKVLEDFWYIHFPKGEKYGISFNSERIKRGILPIPENWETDDYSKYSKVWKPPIIDNNIRQRKIVIANKKEILSEVDYLVKNDSTLEVIYNYDKQDTWEIYLDVKDSAIVEITKNKYDSILLGW